MLHPYYGGFKILPKRWIVERTFAWLGKYRRLSKDYEYKCNTSKTMLFFAMLRNSLKMINKMKKLNFKTPSYSGIQMRIT